MNHEDFIFKKHFLQGLAAAIKKRGMQQIFLKKINKTTSFLISYF